MTTGTNQAFTLVGLTASATLATSQYKLVKLASTAGQVVVCSAATDAALGVLVNDPAAGEAANIVVLGVAPALAEASVSAGDLLAASTTGRVKTTTTANNKVIGRALAASGAAGDLISIIVAPSNY